MPGLESQLLTAFFVLWILVLTAATLFAAVSRYKTAAFVLLVPFGLCALLYWLYAVPTYFRYTLTVHAETGGQVRTASSVIQARYGFGTEPDWKGVAPLFDLGQIGTLVVALDTAAEHKRASGPNLLPLKAYGLSFAYSWETAFYLSSVTLATDDYPLFIWIPPSNDWRQAKLLYHTELPQFLGSASRIVRITVTPNRFAPLVTRFDPAPLWLENLRKDVLIRALGTAPVPLGEFTFILPSVESDRPLRVRDTK